MNNLPLKVLKAVTATAALAEITPSKCPDEQEVWDIAAALHTAAAALADVADELNEMAGGWEPGKKGPTTAECAADWIGDALWPARSAARARDEEQIGEDPNREHRLTASQLGVGEHR